MPFDRIVVTSSNANQCELFRLELERVRAKQCFGLCSETRIFAVSDPLGVRVGSGGATFHAIAEAYEPGKSLLVLHSGGDSRRNPLCCVQGKGFASINFEEQEDEATCPLERLLGQANKLEAGGVLVCCTDTLMTELVIEDKAAAAFANPDAVTGIGMYTDVDFGTRHGVFYPGERDDGFFGILQKATLQELHSTPRCVTAEGKVLLDAGLIHLGANVVRAVLQCMQQDGTAASFRGLTNAGMDAGLQPARFELYTDFLQSLRGMMQPSGSMASSLFGDRFRGFPFCVAKCVESAEFIHLGTTKEHLEFVTCSDDDKILLDKWSRSHIVVVDGEVPDFTSINSMVDARQNHLGSKCLVEHCDLTGGSGRFTIGQGAVVSQLSSTRGEFVVESDMCVQQVRLSRELVESRLGAPVPSVVGSSSLVCFSVFGVRDGVKDQFPTGQYCNRDWSSWDAAVTECLWESKEEQDKSLWTARLFPVLSIPGDDSEPTNLEEALWMMRTATPPSAAVFQRWRDAPRLSLRDLVWVCDMPAQFAWNRVELPRIILAGQLEHAIANRLPYPKRAFDRATTTAQKDDRDALLQELDKLTFAHDDSLNARTLSLVADVLCVGRQSGSACHPDFAGALHELSTTDCSRVHDRLAVLGKLARTRDSAYWRAYPERAARHYDLASQLLTGRSLLMKNDGDVMVTATSLAATGRWIHASAPCRIDLAGGWTDTPPVTNELGGIVCNVAVNLVPDEHALGASCRRRRTPSPSQDVILRYGRYKNDATADNRVVLTSYADLADHANPQAPCALLKCVLLTLFPASSSNNNNNGLFALGLELCVWSDLPAGSGLGGSSILAACALLACARAATGSSSVSRTQICEWVLQVEQLMSTGGGWQDQVGSIYPGFKTTTSRPCTLPIELEVHPLAVTPSQVQEFESRGMLVRTGPARLARDLLQVVVRTWHRRDASFCHAMQELKANALNMTAALLLTTKSSENDEGAVAQQINTYWRLKKQVCGAQQAEPELITRMFEAVDAWVDGKMLCGAGGGGFAFLWLKKTNSDEAFARVCAVLEERFPGAMVVSRVQVCQRGLCVTEEEEEEEE